MSKHRNATLAGGFILLAALLAVVVVVAIEGGGRFSDGARERVARFRFSDDLGGLRVGDDVRVGGYKVGSVSSIEPEGLDGTDPHLRVQFSLPRRYALRSDAVVGIQSTLTGNTCLNIESLGTPGGPEADDRLAGRPDPKTTVFASLARLGNDAAEISHEVRSVTLPKVNLAADRAGQLIQHVDGKVNGVVDQYNDVARRTGGMMDSVHEMIGPSTEDFHGIMRDVHQMTGELQGSLPDLLKQTGAALGSARAAMENTRDISSSLRSVIGGNKNKLDEMIGALKVTADNMRAASFEIRHSPWRLLYKPSSGELSNLNVYDAARQFAEGANELNDAAQALQEASRGGNADRQQVQKMIDRLEKSFATFEEAEKRLWRDVKE